MIIVLCGPSAGGKTITLEALTQGKHLTDNSIHVPELERLVTVTTRTPRPGEVDGVDYNFMAPEQFDQEKRTGNIVEETVYAGVSYGILGSEIRRIADSGKDAIVVLDMHGVEEMRRFYGAENVVSIFVYRDMSIILQELEKRNLPREEVDRRFAQARDELLNISRTDHVVFNLGTVNELVRDVASVIFEERRRRQLIPKYSVMLGLRTFQ